MKRIALTVCGEEDGISLSRCYRVTLTSFSSSLQALLILGALHTHTHFMKTQSEYENAPSSEALSIHGESEHYLTLSEVL